ncbi:cytidine deaminase [bacterium (Candidatus Blackallbacteria) CG17_big_fil_post_rev_8_21_14_2_50_48_46]|uniref:Cytidine deaminase n=1 Tax=bacterium (Candidatus Blackallbacteria) CG17_big_fil_post_rev_8_21_14_2_50_48_46 TaxID=2014261 RepID=A0A2M7G687_9BACT|nr:MAG: cytidine deaminase [bacterium (Candidatus Blackallbacteria) CG18_big_fil_WC_8_21_14_2_50_49_26]PIW17505.1 MAG: cytidine deaminase [bacterium (Candidatus Blackallbacteria) CG17_big_fil_post_rev_8_21_14_2_50_48_46]PIW48359.1 MAG: cytidine deaminase [bacterium (Candidatus Blackallbacteria) CG13_big_fil_rev_8_21_14_2_50_49_14]
MTIHYHRLETLLEIYDQPADLPVEDQALLERARAAAVNSYSPYSNFKVGAAARLATGQVLSGSNQENIAYPSGLCAESIIMFAAGAEYPNDAVVTLAVTTISGPEDSQELVTPCGVCRQVIAEYRNRHGHPIRIIMQGKQGPVYVVADIQGLLPLMFENATVKKNEPAAL